MFFNFLSESTLLRELSFDEKKLRFEENVIFLTKFLGVLYGGRYRHKTNNRWKNVYKVNKKHPNLINIMST